MNLRRIEERAEFPNGIKTEWEPTGRLVPEKESRELVTRLNRMARAEGSCLRHRSVPYDN
jgi:hypothetical protein